MLNTFTPNTKIQSAKVNDNTNNFSNHGRNWSLKWTFPSTLVVENSPDYISLPDGGTIERCDIVAATPPVGAAIIADIEYSDDNGATWASIFTAGNRPQIADGGRAGSSTSPTVTVATALTRLFRAAVDQIGSGTAGADLSVILRGTYDVD